MNKLKIVYFGTPDFSARFLEKLITDTLINQLIKVKLVVTQPDKPVGRKQILTETAVKQVAEKYQISNIKYQKEIRNLKLEIRNFDLALLFAFGQIIPKELLDLPKYGFLNIHPSLLPKYRGASPIAYPLILGDKKTGVTIIEMDEKLDHGPIITQEELRISPTNRRPDLETKLTDLAFAMFKKLIYKMYGQPSGLSLPTPINSNQFQLTAQADQHATYTRLLKKSDGFVPLSTLKKALNNEPLTFKELPKILQEIENWKLVPSEVEGLEIRNSPKIIYNYFRGLYPWPGIWTILPNGKRLKITDMKLSNFKNFPTLKLEKVQLEGKKEVEFSIFNKAYKMF